MRLFSPFCILGVVSCCLFSCIDDDDIYKNYDRFSNIVPGSLYDEDGLLPESFLLTAVAPDFIFEFEKDGCLRSVYNHDGDIEYVATPNSLSAKISRGRYSFSEEYKFYFKNNLIEKAIVVTHEHDGSVYWDYRDNYSFAYNNRGQLRFISCDRHKSSNESGVYVSSYFDSDTELEYKNGELLYISHEDKDRHANYVETHEYEFETRNAELNRYYQYTPLFVKSIFGNYDNVRGSYGLCAMAFLGYFGLASSYLPMGCYYDWHIDDNFILVDKGSDFIRADYRFYKEDYDAISTADRCEYIYVE